MNELTKLWRELHRNAVEYPVTATAEDKKQLSNWFKQWVAKFPEDCACLEEYNEALTLAPVPDGGRWELFWWTVALHDRINILLGVGIFSRKSLDHPLLSDLPTPEPVRRQSLRLGPRDKTGKVVKAKKRKCKGRKCRKTKIATNP